MQIQEFTDKQMSRLQQAKSMGKYGALESWQELFTYQLTCGNLTQIQEIGEWAHKFNLGKGIRLPLKENGKTNR